MVSAQGYQDIWRLVSFISEKETNGAGAARLKIASVKEGAL
jgi:hypothetical protein